MLGLGIAVCLVVSILWITPLFVLLRHANEAEIQKQHAEYEMIFHAVLPELRFKAISQKEYPYAMMWRPAGSEYPSWTTQAISGKDVTVIA